jgi:glucokinase
VPVAALDVGGTGIKAGVFGDDGAWLARRRAATPGGGPEAVADAIASLVAALREDAGDVRCVGLAVPGIVDEAAGVVRRGENLGWVNVPVRALVRERCGLPVVLAHDVRAAGLAELRRGAGAGASDLVYVSIGTGIGAAVFVAGAPLVRGGYAGEIGHAPVVSGDSAGGIGHPAAFGDSAGGIGHPAAVGDSAGGIGHPAAFGGEPCACGGRGCLETIASARAIARRYGAGGAEEVLAAALAGDARAVAIVDEAVEALAFALAWVVAVVVPERIVLGGGLSLAGPAWLERIDAALRRRLTFQPAPELRLAELRDEAGCLGAGLLALEAGG